MKLARQLPDFYSHFVAKNILSMEINEKIATCDNCFRARQKCGTYHYQPQLKCCTFYPFLPNYIVGAILSEKASEYQMGQKRIMDLIDSQESLVLPMGIMAPIQYQIEFNRDKTTQFGRNENWLCPYYNSENDKCTIWRYRGSVCTSFYCKSSFGRSGKAFWKELESYLSYLEMGLMEESLVHLDFTPRQISDMLVFLNVRDLSDLESEFEFAKLTEKQSKKYWNGYCSDKIGFFIKCFQLTLNFKRGEVKSVLGEPGSRLEKKLRAAFDDLTQKVTQKE